jgi:hypothetical protein
MIVGDPHLDDPGCAWPALQRVVKIIAETEGCYGICVGDVNNNWVGARLMKLWAKQDTTAKEAARLARWLALACPWLVWQLGNHDLWNNGGTLIRWLLHGSRVKWTVDHQAFVHLVFPSATIPVMVRHSYKGSSIYNDAHGPLRAALFDPRAEVYAQGHHHTWAEHSQEGTDGVRRVALKVAGYKKMDDFAAEKGFHESRHGESCLVIIDPRAHPMRRVDVWWDLEAGADYLRYLRRAHG